MSTQPLTHVKTPTRTYAVEYGIGDTVWLKVRDEPVEGVVTGIGIRPGTVYYNVRWADGIEESHFGIELTSERSL